MNEAEKQELAQELADDIALSRAAGHTKVAVAIETIERLLADANARVDRMMKKLDDKDKQ